MLTFGKWFTLNFFVNCFPKTHASPPALSALFSHNTVKYFPEHFPECNQTRKKNHFPRNYFHLKTFCNGKYFTAKQTELYVTQSTNGAPPPPLQHKLLTMHLSSFSILVCWRHTILYFHLTKTKHAL